MRANKRTRRIQIVLTTAVALVMATAPRLARAHCDTLNGPVVKAAQLALERGDVTPVLKWVRKEHEAAVREAFVRTLRVRNISPDARELADRYFFETVVRLHRESEGEPYTGLKPARTDPGPAVREADLALEKGNVDTLVKLLTDEVSKGVRERFARARERRAKAEDSIEAGREFVAAYVEFVHFAERVHAEATGEAPSHEAGD